MVCFRYHVQLLLVSVLPERLHLTVAELTILVRELHTLKLPRYPASVACRLVCVQRTIACWSPDRMSVLF